jgi:acetyl-CoA C-acetyltransferase
METPVILSAVRTPIGKFQGGLSSFSAVDLGAKAVAEAIRRSGLEAKQVDEAILGNVVQAGLGQNPARQAALKGGCDPRVAAMTINKVCGSGLKAVALAAQAVQLGESEIVVAGGMESMSNCPYLLPQARTGYRLGDGKIRRFSHGHDRRVGGGEIWDWARGAGPLRGGEPSESGAGS